MNWRLSIRPKRTAAGHVAHAMAPRKVESVRTVKKRDTWGRHDECTKKCEPHKSNVGHCEVRVVKMYVVCTMG